MTLTDLLPFDSLRALGDAVVTIARDAGEGVMVHYKSQDDLGVMIKQDGSPVTIADRDAHDSIKRALNQLAVAEPIPILSEESSRTVDFEERRHWDHFWLIDPIDGTREFIAGTGHFSVNIALISGGKAIMGVVHIPVTGETYLGIPGDGSWRRAGAGLSPIRVNALEAGAESLSLMRSKRRPTPDVERCLSLLRERFNHIREQQIGSSIKFCRIAEGDGDFFACLGPTSQWDSAAAQAVVEGAGGKVVDSSFKTISYNRESLLNPFFFVLGGGDYPWQPLIEQILPGD